MWLTYEYFEYYLFMLPALALVLLAQVMVKSRYKTFSTVQTVRRVTGREVAEKILAQSGITDVRVASVAGKMTDHYHPSKKTIFLSEGVYASTSIAAIGIAAHEAGHAVQHATGYVPVHIRTAMVPVCNIGSMIGLPLAMIGALTQAFQLVNIGLLLFAAVTVFQLVTLPVEFNASRRALAFIKSSGMFFENEYSGAKKVLTAAAMTYVAALAQSVIQLLYFVLRFTGSRRD